MRGSDDARLRIGEQHDAAIGACHPETHALRRGDEAVELVRSLEPDLAILDIKMPGLDGLSAARQIASDRLAAVLILTAFSQRELVEQAREAGAPPLLEGFSYDFSPEDRVGIIGPNGVGKSSLLEVIAGRLTPGDLVMFLVFMAMLLEPVATIAGTLTQLQSNLAGFDRVLDLLAEPLDMATAVPVA